MSFDLETTFPTLKKAPITEAVIDLQAAIPPDVSLARLREFQVGLERRFTEVNERRSVRAQIEHAQTSVPKVIAPTPTPDGYLFRSPSENLIV
jgi:hypothetical protein